MVSRRGDCQKQFLTFLQCVFFTFLLFRQQSSKEWSWVLCLRRLLSCELGDKLHGKLLVDFVLHRQCLKGERAPNSRELEEDLQSKLLCSLFLHLTISR